jgi:hypothetical protein
MGMYCRVERVVAAIAFIPGSNSPELNPEIVKHRLTFRADIFVSFLEGVIAGYLSAL